MLAWSQTRFFITLAVAVLLVMEAVSWITAPIPGGCIVNPENYGTYYAEGNHCPTFHVFLFVLVARIVESLGEPNWVIADFTVVLAFSTIGLWVVTWRASDRQVRETEILQRAYISIEAIGFEPFRSDPKNFGDARIQVTNVGKLPARKVSWIASRKFSRKADLEWFPVNESRMEGNSVIPPGAEMKKGTLRISAQRFDRFKRGMGTRDRFLYVWGLIRYEDGFGQMRFTRFCHRYNIAALETDPSWGLRIWSTEARHHEHGNDAD